MEPIKPRPGYATAIAFFQPSDHDMQPRWVILNIASNKWRAFDRRSTAAAYMQDEGAVLGGMMGSGTGPAQVERDYKGVKWEWSGSPSFAYRAEYEGLVAALREEAKRRQWCDDWKVFARAAGVPEELIEPKRTVRVTIEVELDAKYDTTNKQHIAYALKVEPTVEFTNAVKKVEEI